MRPHPPFKTSKAPITSFLTRNLNHITHFMSDIKKLSNEMKLSNI